MISMDSSILSGSENTPGDTRQRHIKYAAALRERYPNGDLTILARAPRSHLTGPVQVTDALTIHPVPSRRVTFPMAAWRLLDGLMKSESFDMASTQTPFDDGLVAMWLRRRYGVPLNVQMRTSFLDMGWWISERPLLYRALNAVGKWVAKRADTIRVVSEGERHRLEELFPALQGKVHALHPMVNHQLFDGLVGEDERAALETEMKAAGLEERPFVLFVGRLVKQKNLPLLLRSFALVRRERPDLALVLAGEGALMEESRALADGLGIGREVLWLGSRPLAELKVWYAGASATLVPSFHEGFGKVIVESYLAGTPCVVTPFVSAPELVVQDETGAVSSSFDDDEEFAEHSLRVVRESEKMGAIGKAHVLRYMLSDEAYTDRLIDIWEATAGRSPVTSHA